MFKPAVILSLVAATAMAAEVGWSGKLSSLDGGLGGTVKVLNDSALDISGYTLKDASAPALYWWGSTTDKLSSGFRINNESVDKAAITSNIVIALDAGKKPADFSTVGLWCEKFNANFGQAALTKDGTGSDFGARPSAVPKAGAAVCSGNAQPVAIFALVVAVAFASQLI